MTVIFTRHSIFRGHWQRSATEREIFCFQNGEISPLRCEMTLGKGEMTIFASLRNDRQKGLRSDTSKASSLVDCEKTV